MKFDVCSDLHVDHHLSLIDWAEWKNPDSTVLIIAGDVSNKIVNTVAVVMDAAQHYEHVVFVDGNHEHYDHELCVSDNIRLMHSAFDRIPNVHFLDGELRATWQHEGTLFVGGMGWYDWICYERMNISHRRAYGSWLEGSNDAREIQWDDDMRPDTMASVHAVNLSTEVHEAQQDAGVERIVMVTHSSPDARLMWWRPENPAWNEQTPSYVNSQMSQVVEQDAGKKIQYWIYGHTHFRSYRVLDGIHYINNSRGYPREASDYFLPQFEA
jgi:predicted phosphodiesterase